ncbi:MAG: hypothetical protein JXA33_02310, partial [Anaerolineae bacterium]|nr:hypothetical protein [Anaerolineae bacterium]
MYKKWTLGALLGLFAGLLFLISYQVSADYLFMPRYLSDEETACEAVLPRSAMTEDGEWMVASWIQGREYETGGQDPECRRAGDVELRWATGTGAADSWSDRVIVLPGTPPSGACTIHADVAITNTSGGAVAHIVATVRDPCFVNETEAQTTTVKYLTYTLPGGELSAVEDVVTTYKENDELIRNVRIALDGEGKPQVVYGVADYEGELGAIYYTYRATSGVWVGDPENLEPLRLSSATTEAYSPEVAWSMGRTHIVWEIHLPPITQGRNGNVYYVFCTETGGCITPRPLDDPNINTHPGPTIAARGDRVMVTWSRCIEADANAPCEQFIPIYARSNTSGTTWSLSPTGVERKVVGTDQAYNQVIPPPASTKNSTDAGDGEYITFLRPYVILDHNQLPAVSWQTKTMSEGHEVYMITAAYAVSETDASFTWAYVEGNGGDGLLDAVVSTITVPQLAEGEVGHHLIYMQAQPYGIREPYRVYYDYFGDGKVTPEPTPEE